jgi:hypothetical protein
MNTRQIRFLLRCGLAAAVLAALLAYSAEYDWGLSRGLIRFSALIGALLIGTVLVIDRNLSKLSKWLASQYGERIFKNLAP